MYQQLEAYIRQRVDTSEELLQLVVGQFKPVKAKRGQDLLLPGNICRDCYFVNKGGVQLYTVDKDGNESTRDLLFENEFVTSIPSFINGIPALQGMRAIESADLLAISREQFDQMNQSVPQFARIYQHNLEKYYSDSIQRLNNLMSMDSLDRVRWIYTHRPHLLQRVSNRLLASYLNINPATLSRLKHKL